MPLVDTHCHLDDEQFADDLDAVLARMREAGVAAAVTIGTGADSSVRAAALAGTHPDLYAGVGVHPNDPAGDSGSERWPEIEALARRPRVVAVGETGLDYYREGVPRGIQRDRFARHIALARAVGKPVVIHCREAYGDCLAQLRAAWPPPVRGVLHCFGGTADDARSALDLGLLVSVGGPVTFPNAHALREVLRMVPADRLLVETDAPYLAPQSRRGKRNEPACVAETAAALARARGAAPEDLAGRTTANACTLFGFAVGT